MRGQKSVSLAVGFELAEDLLSFTGRLVRYIDRVVQALARAMVGAGHPYLDRFDVVTRFVGDDDSRVAKPRNQSFETALCRFGIPARLYENIKNISTGVDRAPQPVLLDTDRDHGFVHAPLVVRSRSIPSEAIREMWTKTIGPQPDRVPADNHTPRG